MTQICTAPDCGREAKHPKKGLCNRCYQRHRRAIPALKAAHAASSKRWYLRKNGRELGLKASRRFRSEHPLYHIWQGIRRRTGDPRTKNYPEYGGRGIQMFGPWRDNLAAFETWINDNLGPRPKGHSLDRIDNDGHYEPGNLRWADQRTQRENTRERIAYRERLMFLQRISNLESYIDAALERAAA